ncbi:hypothetical protein PR048_011721 [Dryococelus australis]|uniref:Uncharacterized protein n=1 Tax=Dryococelus australis TaxID=614101 RepID=A0ABQ9HMF1_9NEOP|nr:hypothetical protein PR048_011721 [Dryococelus australis]
MGISGPTFCCICASFASKIPILKTYREFLGPDWTEASEISNYGAIGGKMANPGRRQQLENTSSIAESVISLRSSVHTMVNTAADHGVFNLPVDSRSRIQDSPACDDVTGGRRGDWRPGMANRLMAKSIGHRSQSRGAAILSRHPTTILGVIDLLPLNRVSATLVTGISDPGSDRRQGSATQGSGEHDGRCSVERPTGHRARVTMIPSYPPWVAAGQQRGVGVGRDRYYSPPPPHHIIVRLFSSDVGHWQRSNDLAPLSRGWTTLLGYLQATSLSCSGQGLPLPMLWLYTCKASGGNLTHTSYWNEARFTARRVYTHSGFCETGFRIVLKPYTKNYQCFGMSEEILSALETEVLRANAGEKVDSVELTVVLFVEHVEPVESVKNVEQSVKNAKQIVEHVEVIKQNVHLPVIVNTIENVIEQKHAIILPPNIRCIISSPSSCGKTCVIMSLLEHPNGLMFENIYMFSKTMQEKYQLLANILSLIEGIQYFLFANKEDTVLRNEA